MATLWTTVKQSAVGRLGRNVLVGYAVLLGVGVIVVITSIALMWF